MLLPLSGLTRLLVLGADRLAEAADLSPLASLPALRHLNLSSGRLKGQRYGMLDLDQLSSCTSAPRCRVWT